MIIPTSQVPNIILKNTLIHSNLDLGTSHLGVSLHLVAISWDTEFLFSKLLPI